MKMVVKPENTIIEANENDETSSINTNLGASFVNMKKSFANKPAAPTDKKASAKMLVRQPTKDVNPMT